MNYFTLYRFTTGKQEHQTSETFVLEVMNTERTVEYIWHIKGFHGLCCIHIHYILRSLKLIK